MPTQTKLPTFGNKLLTFSAAGILLASQAFAQDQSEQAASSANAERQQDPAFQELDEDQDELLLWREIHVVMDPRIVAAGLDQEQIFEQYDANDDDALDEQEFDEFLSGLQDVEGETGDQTAMGGSDSQMRGSSDQQSGALAAQDSQTGMDRDQSALSQNESSASSESDWETDSQASESDAQRDAGIASTSDEASGQVGDTRADTDVQTDPSVETGARGAITSSPTTDRTTGSEADVSAASEPVGQPQLSSRPDSAQSGSDMDEEIDEESDMGDQSSQRMSATAGSSSDMERDQSSQSMSATGSEVEMEGGQASQQQSSAAGSGSDMETEGSQQMTGAQEPQEYDTQAMQATVDSLQGRPVENAEGQEIGDVEDVVINGQNGQVGLVISSGGMLGIGSSEILAPVEEITFSDERLVWNTSRSKKELRNSEQYNAEGFNSIASDTGSEGISQR